MTSKPRNVLILCTGNSARSILAEAIINRIGQGRLHAFSAGSQPKGVPNPVGIALLAERGYDVGVFRSKSWHEFAMPGAPVMDIVITVCDSAAGEACPFWPGAPVTAHWGIPDPAEDHGSPTLNRAAFELAYERLFKRAEALAALPIETMPLEALKRQLAAIGHLEGATALACSDSRATD